MSYVLPQAHFYGQKSKLSYLKNNLPTDFSQIFSKLLRNLSLLIYQIILDMGYSFMHKQLCINVSKSVTGCNKPL